MLTHVIVKVISLKIYDVIMWRVQVDKLLGLPTGEYCKIEQNYQILFYC